MDTPELNITQSQLKYIGKIDEFKGKWQAMSGLAPDRLKALRKIATIESIGSSTRIEGAKLSDSQVEELLAGVKVTSFNTRDEQEVAGYAECINTVFESYPHIPIDENHVKQLHQLLLKYSSKDTRHCGEYKKLPNHLEAYGHDGKSLGVIFETASPFDTPRKMAELLEWFNRQQNENSVHVLLLIAIFIVHFLAIHPFQDGNGRLSRILTTLLLLQAGYTYVPFCSLERIVEENKDRYYLTLRQAQKTIYKDNSTIGVWVTFYLELLNQQTEVLEQKTKNEQVFADISVLSKDILQIAKDHGRVTVRQAVQITKSNRNTTKAHLKRLVKNGLLEQMGDGKGTWYKIKRL